MLLWRKHSQLIKFSLLLVLILILGLMFVRNLIYPVFFTIAQARVYQMGNRIVSEVVKQETGDLDYRDLINYEQNEQGDIKLMQANTKGINQLTSRMTLSIQQHFQSRVTVQVPLLKILGLDMLAGIGPDVSGEIVPVGYVSPPEIVDSFEAKGINQTRHKLYLKTRMKFKLIAPLAQKKFHVQAEVPLIETTILGEVPDTYIDFNSNQDTGILK
ncbi:MAG: sporulation protein YunB [Bacillota bacterium]